jgi:hypothetical protein
MKRHVFFAAPLFALYSIGATAALAASMEYDQATTYEVTVQKIELCASGSSIDGTGASAPVCVDPYVVGTTTSSFDIASALAGGALGNYANINTLPAGKTYTHIRLTLSRRFDIAGLLTNSTCRTDSSDTHSNTTSAGWGIHDGAAGTVQELHLADVGSYGGGHPTNAEYWSDGIDIIDDSSFYFMNALTQPVAGGGAPPTITISFNTQSALSGYWIGEGETCFMYPARPSVEITIQ